MLSRALIASLLVAWFLVASFLAGCSTARVVPPGVTPERFTQIREECEATAAQGASSDPVKTGLKWGALSSVYLAFAGAADGAWFGAVTGGSAGQAALIGAAAGVGLGAIVGLVAGIKQGVDARRDYNTRYEQCVSERAVPPPASSALPAEYD